ncbi:unnamed protein product [Lasius platythorax]|uniref:MADF domain-containing protein n=1 Tax=Lasius platythorax TaxID=488582 RepID=A0AAV2MXM0_9HYME
MNIKDYLNLPRKCAICKTIISDKEILEKHICFCNYPYICVDENGHLCPQREDETIIYEPASSHSTAAVCEDIEELLISNVRKRRALWDHTLPIAKRSRDIITTHWQEISKELNGILTPNAACKKWRYHKDSYTRICNDVIKKKSGSATSKPVKWKWYEYMKFLHDTQDSHNTATNIPSKSSDCASTSEISEFEEEAAHMQKRRKRSNNSDMLETLSSIMREPIKIETSLQAEKTVRAPEPAQDNITNIIIVIGNLLREFPNNEGFSFALKLLHLTSEKGDQLRKKI